MEYTLLIIVVVAILIIAIKYFDRRKPEAQRKQSNIYRYTAKSSLMSPSESDFFKMLVEAVDSRYFVFPQVHLSTLLDEKTVGQNWKAAFRHINSKSVDYVLCDRITLKPVYAVELDDYTHQRVDRIQRDREVERIFSAANVPLIRFSNYKSLNQIDIINAFADVSSLSRRTL